MKKAVIVLCAIFVLIALIKIGIAYTEIKDEPVSRNGRYELFQAVHEEYVGSGKQMSKISVRKVFKLDTETGKVWSYALNDSGGKQAETGWVLEQERN